MSSLRRTCASRANGYLSRGPATPQGKLRSARTSLRHGLLARCVALGAECPRTVAAQSPGASLDRLADAPGADPPNRVLPNEPSPISGHLPPPADESAPVPSLTLLGSLLPAASSVMVDVGRLHINDKVMHFGACLPNCTGRYLRLTRRVK